MRRSVPLCVCLLLCTVGLSANSVFVDPSFGFDGTYYDYSYSVSLVPDAGEGIFELDLNGIPGLVPDSLQIGSPTNWSASADFTANTISWISDTYTDDIFTTPLPGFSFKSIYGPGGALPFDVMLENSDSTLAGQLNGSTSGPLSAVPEPSTVWMILGAGALLMARRRAFGAAALCVMGGLCAGNAAAAPTVSVQVSGSPSWAPDITIRAAKSAQLLGTASNVSGSVRFTWQQVSGPNTLRWSNKMVASPIIIGAVFGTYVVRLTATDATGSTSTDFRFGAVPTDDAGVVTPPSNDVAFLFAPMIRWGASPWPWLDERHRALADGFGDLMTNNVKYNSSDWNTALAGTISGTLGFFYINGVGTTFQQDFCGGVGNTTPLPDSRLVLWYPAPGGGTGRYPIQITGCPSQTQVTLRYQFPFDSSLGANVSYSKLSCFSCWTEGSNYINFYDNVLSYYGLYYRSGRTEYLNYARTLASRWYQGVTFDQGRVYWFGTPRRSSPKDMNLIGLMWWATETGQTDVWNSLYPGLDFYASDQSPVATVGDVREESFEFAYLAVASRLAPDLTKRQSYQTALSQALTNRWVPSQQPAGYFLQKFYFQPGTVNVTNGSDLVTLNGATLTPGYWTQGPNYSFWVSYDSTHQNGDPTTYLSPTYVSPTSFRLPRPYEGPTAIGRLWEYYIFVGTGIQPFFQAITVRAMDLAYRASGDVRARNINVGLAQWLASNAVQISTKGIYYGMIFPNCQPLVDNVPWCSYDPADPTSVTYGRYNLSLFLGGFSGAMVNAPSPGFASNVDLPAGGSFGKLGGPQSDSEYDQLLDTSVSREWFKDLGSFYGFGQAYSWPAARTGTPNSVINGR